MMSTIGSSTSASSTSTNNIYGATNFELPNAKLVAKDLCFYYGTTQALNNINMCIVDRKVTALVGPSGCGKSTLLRTFNRMFELYPQQTVTGEILLNGENILDRRQDVSKLRSKVGMVFQRPTPFPMSIFDNVAFGIKLYESLSSAEMETRVQWALQKADLWKEVKDKLKKTGSSLSGGQQQRLCIARAIAVKPEVLLLDEPTSALDPISSANIEDLINELKADYSVAIVTHNMHQASRVSDFTAFMYMGKLIEVGPTTTIFTKPKNKMTEEYITGRFG